MGAAISRRLARSGYHVCLTYRTRGDSAAAVVEDIRGGGGSADMHAVDLSDTEAVDEFGSYVCSLGTPPSVLVNCAGEVLRSTLQETNLDQFLRSLTVNCVAPFVLARRIGPAMRANGGGSIVNIASVLGSAGGQGRVAYTTSKAAVIGMTKALAVELSPSVRVNALLPGLFATDMNAALLEDRDMLVAVTDRIPLHRLGDADELAEVAVFLAGPASSYVTGAAWEVDGGALARISLPVADST